MAGLYPISPYTFFSQAHIISFFSSWPASWSFTFGDEIWHFRYGDKGTWQMYPVNIHNTRSLIRTLKVCPRHHCIQKKPLRWKSVNTHIHTKHCNGKSNRREADKKPNSASEIPVIFQNYYPLTSSNLPKSISLPIFLNCHYFNQNIFIKLTDKQRDHLLIMYANLEGGRVKPKAYK